MQTSLFLFPIWNAPKNIHSAMTLRTDGVSQKPYASFNLATHVNDDTSTVLKNRHLLKTRLNLPSEPFWLEQIHSNTVIQANKISVLDKADASYTNQADVVCIVMTADCLPILLCSKNGEEIAAIHAGWRGLASDIISETVLNFKSKNLIAWLGAAIAPCCFEVGDDVRNIFLNKSACYANAFNKNQTGYWFADIYELARIQLTFLGINQVYGGEFCTMCDEQRFYSYRRDKQTGRMATLIWRT